MQDVSVLPAFRMCLPFSVKMSWYIASWIDSEVCCHSDSKSKQVDEISHHNTDKLVYYPLAVIRFSNKSNLREKGFVLTFPRTQFFTPEKALKSESSADSHMVSVVKKHRALIAHA